ncbi:MAG: glycosyltransferase family 2 protein [Bacilli bacterium]|nr:glycosyltransferase family 2 protein [Bacilli bacterium]
MKKTTKNLLLILTLFIISIAFFTIPTLIYPDSTIYYHTAKIFLGLDSFSSWDVVRGPTMAAVQFVFLKIFGNHEISLRICLYTFYISLLIISYIFVNKTLNKNNIKGFKKYISYILLLLFIILNPILFGYYHGLLTEFVAITFSIINCIFVIYINRQKDINNKRLVLYIFGLTIMFVFAWFLKQPYFTISLFPIFCVVFLKIKNTKKIIKNSLLLIIPTIILLLSINMWKVFLEYKNVDYEGGENNSYFLSNSILNGNSNYDKKFDDEYYTIEYVLNDEYLSFEDKNKIINMLNNNNKNYIIYYIHNINEEILGAKVFYYNNAPFSTSEAIIFTVNAFTEHPIIFIDSYISNYLASINVYVSSSYKNYYRPVKQILNFEGENKSIGLHFLEDVDSNFKWIQPYHSYVNNLKIDNINNNFVKILYSPFIKINTIGFKLLYLLLPFIWLFSFIKIFKKNGKKYEIAFIFLSFSLLHTLFHVVTGAIIDRYIYISLPATILGIISLITINKESEVVKMKKNINKSNKILFVIPAYNEAENIEKVLKEIKTDVNYADILVINDCSKDNTKEIVEKNKVKCITNIFNMKYAMAVQTGIKYAYENDYDFVIQFDADGQHIAKEAVKMIEKQKETNCDIVIGSRYLVDMGYPCPLFRRIGTKFFSFLINLFCKKKVADPLSGFQLLNRNVIEYYSKMGNYPEFPDANLVMEMLYQGYKIEEVPVKMRLRETGESMHGGIIKPIKYMIKIFYTICFIVIKNIGRKVDGK